MAEKIGVVDAGGGFRGIYAAGVLDYCLDHHIQFDLGVGVSAGSANLMSYAAGQARRNLIFYSVYGLRKEYAGLGNFIRQRSFINMDYVYGTLSNSDGENPLDYAAVAANPMKYYAVATNARTGQARYFGLEDIPRDDYSVLKASCAIPFVCHPYKVRGVSYFDGALSDPVPVEKAFAMGCDKVVVLLTLPADTIRTAKRDRSLARKIYRRYPQAARQLVLRALRYNQAVKKAKEYARQDKVLIVAPEDTCGVSTLCRDADALRRLYRRGYTDGAKITTFLNG